MVLAMNVLSRFPLKIWRLAWPIILSNICIPALGIIDIAVIGQDPDKNQLTAIAIGSVFFDILLGLMNFLRMSTTGLVAQSPDEPTIFHRSFLIATALASVTLLLSPLLWTACFLFSDQNSAIYQPLKLYFDIRCLAVPASLFQYVLIGYCFGRQETRLPLVLLLFSNTLAIGLDLLLVYVYQQGTVGIALANVFSQWSGFVAGLYLLKKRFNIRLFILNAFYAPISTYVQLLSINKDIFIRSLCLMLSIGYFTHASASLGGDIVSANAMLMSLLLFMSYAMDGFAIACESLVGQAWGKLDRAMFLSAIYQCCNWCALIALLFSLILWGAGNSIVSLMSEHVAINQLATQYLPWLYFISIIAFPCYLLDGVFIGATWSNEMRQTMLFACLLVFVPLMSFTINHNNHYLWFCYAAFLVARGMSQLYVLKKKLKLTHW
jgi:MATE family multidrug resistance protein